MLTRRGGYIILFGISMELFALSFYAIRDFASFIKDTLNYDLSTYFPNIYNLVYLSPFLIIIGTLVLTSVAFSFSSFQYFSKLGFIDIDRKLSTNRVFEGDFVFVTLRIKNKSAFWISSLFVSDIIPDTFDLVFGENFVVISLPPKGSIEFSYVIRCSSRGVYKIGPVQLVIQDRAGFFMKNYLIEMYNEIMVYPSYEDVRRFEFLQKVYGTLLFGRYRVREKGHGYDFSSLRSYLPGDSIRQIDWKASARKGALIVKEYEAEKNVKLYIFLDSSLTMGLGSKHRTKLDYAARAAVLLSYLASRTQDLFGLVVYSEEIKDYIPARKGRRHFYKILEALAKADPTGSSNLSRVMKEFITRERRASLAIIITDLEGDPTNIEEAVKTAIAHKVRPIFISPIGPLFEVLETDTLSKAFFEVVLTEYMMRREQIKQRLAKYGIQVIDVGPEDLLAISLETFLRAKARGGGVL